MQPQDFPVEYLSNLEGTLIGTADVQRDRARAATLEGADAPKGDHRNIPGHPIGFYESALAYYESARQVTQATHAIVKDLADKAAAEQDQATDESHPWPLEHTTNQALVHPDSYSVPNKDKRFPRWGIEGYTGDPDTETYVSLCPAANSDDGDIILRISTGVTGRSKQPATTEQTVRISQAQWAALELLAARIRAGQPIPYDDEGHVLSQLEVNL